MSRTLILLLCALVACTNRTDLRVPKELGDPCRQNDECPATCIAGACAEYADNGEACDEAADCVPGLLCPAGSCEVDYCEDRSGNAPYANSGESGMDGSSEQTAFTLCTVEQLRALEATPADWGSYFSLRRDLDLAGTAVAIGTFTGHFDGRDHVISGYAVTTDADNVGLFGVITGGGTLANLTMADVDITGDRNVGAFAAKADDGATLENLHLIGSSTIRGNCLVGGIVGFLNGELGYSSTASGTRIVARTSSCSEHGGLVGEGTDTTFIHDSHASGSIEGSFRSGGAIGAVWGAADRVVLARVWADVEITVATNEFEIGGLVGAVTNSNIEDCYATGDVLAPTADSIGGLVGYMNGSTTITRSYSDNTVQGTQSVGGLVGVADLGTSMVNSFSTSDVVGEFWAGKLIGDDRWVVISNSYVGNASGSCTMPVSETCNATGSEADTATNPDHFFGGGAPIDTWDLISTWVLPGGALPLLRP